MLARPVVLEVLGRADPAYRVVGGRAGNPAQRFAVTFSRAGAMVVVGSSRLRLTLERVGYGRALHSLAEVAPGVAGNRVVYRRGGVREWYVNGPWGLEQGFDVLRRPAGRDGRLSLAVGVAGDLHARLDREGVVLEGSGVRLRYGGLTVTDAGGRVLRSWFALSGGRVVIGVADRGARYPLRIDPFVQQGSKLVGAGAAGMANQGASVALSADGSTALVGGPGDNGGAGAVWVFTRVRRSFRASSAIVNTVGACAHLALSAPPPDMLVPR